jgi:LysR family transcriptional regulator, regulator for bpeEF and oprC
MDKLRAIQYFVAAAETGSLSRAARSLEVSVPAVQKLISALEATLGVSLLERDAKGTRLTIAGSAYLDCCRPLLEELKSAEEDLAGRPARLSGVLAVATNEQIAHHILLPALPRFRMRYPDVHLDFRTVHRVTDADAAIAEVLVLHGWLDTMQDYVHRNLGMTRTFIVAAPDYWTKRGIPSDPDELVWHDCLMMRNPSGIEIDLWEFERHGESRSVKVNGWLTSNAREVVLDGVLKGQGVGRFTEVTMRSHLQSGRLVPVLMDWTALGGPPINLFYKASTRKNTAAKAFIEWVQQLLAQHDAEGQFHMQHPTAERPGWHRRGYSRASAAVRNKQQ